MTAVATEPGDDVAASFADGATILVGDPGDAVVFLAAAADRIDAPRLERLQDLAGGLTLLGLGARRAADLGLHPLPGAGVSLGLRIAAPVDAARGIRGGWSARDRAHTIRVAADPGSRPGDLSVPGHVHAAGLDERSAAPALAALELARGAGCRPGVVLGVVTDDTGRPAPLAHARRHPELGRLPHASAAAIRGRALAERAGGRLVECALPTRDGRFRALALDDPDADHDRRGSVVALVHGDPARMPEPLVHVHPACLLGDAFGSLLCDCGAELAAVTEAIAAMGAGVIVYVKPGTADPERRYHCGRDTPVDLAPVLALLRACGIDPGLAGVPHVGSDGDAAAAGPAGRWLSLRRTS
jgi:3,4-dihydroxy-2-butanone 4-phosphate synthase